MRRESMPSKFAVSLTAVALVAGGVGGALAAPGISAAKGGLTGSEKSAIKSYSKKYAKKYVNKLTPPAGPQGPAGPAGPSSAVEAASSGSATFASATEHTVASNAGLPAGSYLITAKVNLALTEAGTGHGVCHINAGADDDTAFFWDMGYNGLIPQVYTFNMSTVHTFAATGTTSVLCQVNGTHWTASDAHITATHLGSGTRIAG